MITLIEKLSTSTLLIGYYHGLLLRDTTAESLVGDLFSTGLLTAQELKVILSGHSSHHRNWLLLEYVQHMDSQALLAFSKLIKDVWPQISIQLVTGNYFVMKLIIYSYRYIHIHSVMVEYMGCNVVMIIIHNYYWICKQWHSQGGPGWAHALPTYIPCLPKCL